MLWPLNKYICMYNMCVYIQYNIILWYDNEPLTWKLLGNFGELHFSLWWLDDLIWLRQASIVLRRLDGVASGSDISQVPIETELKTWGDIQKWIEKPKQLRLKKAGVNLFFFECPYSFSRVVVTMMIQSRYLRWYNVSRNFQPGVASKIRSFTRIGCHI